MDALALFPRPGRPPLLLPSLPIIFHSQMLPPVPLGTSIEYWECSHVQIPFDKLYASLAANLHNEHVSLHTSCNGSSILVGGVGGGGG